MGGAKEQRWGAFAGDISQAAGAIIALIALTVLIGWTTEVPGLRALGAGSSSMKANAALAFVLAGVALALSNERFPRPILRRIARILSGVVVFIGLWTVGEYLFPGLAPIDQILLADHSPDPASPGRMAFASAAGFALLGTALLLLDWPRLLPIAELAATLTFIASLFTCVAYAYGGTELLGPATYTNMTIDAALLLLLLSLGVLHIRKGAFRSLLTSSSPGGILIRRMLPAAILIPVVVGYSRLLGQRAGFYGTEFGLTLYTLSQIIIFGALVVWMSFSARRAHIESRRLDLARSQSESMFEHLFESAPDSVIAVSRDGRILRVNAQCERVFGYMREQLIGRPVEILIPERYGARHIHQRDAYFANPRARPMGAGMDLYARKRDGSEFPVEISLNPLQTEEGPIVLGTIVDITERRQHEQQLHATAEELSRSNTELARSNADLEQFAYVASHDLQEPLRAVAGCVQILRQRYQSHLDAGADELITHAVEGASRMQTLLNDLLQFSRVGTRGKPFEPVDLNVILKQVKANLSVAIAESKATIHLDGETLPIVTADPTQMSQIFQNLISNALKFRSAGTPPEVRIRADHDNGEWTLSVADNGIGMESQYFERIFGVFQRLHTRREYPGTGIGLAICKKIVERHGGRIWVKSQPGKGSTFHFTIPDRTPTP